MKKIFYLLVLGATSLPLAAQVLSNGNILSGATNSNVIFDASTAFSTEAGAGANVGKGIVIPSVNLVNFQFDLSLADGFTFPTFFDGMIVYNNASGTTLTAGNRSSTATLVTPGYYYFFNPNGGTNQTVQPGVWKPLGGGDAKFNVVNGAAAGVATNTLVDGTPVYAYKGQFTTTGSSTAVTITPPTGITSLYGITIFKRATTGNKIVFSKELYSYNTTTGAAVTGSPNISVVYPADTYDYILEYLK